MTFNLDSTIFIGFLAVTVVIGLFSSRGTNTIKQYAVGDRNFSTATIVATIVATWISGEFFYSSISEAYVNGLYSIWIALGDPLYLLCIGLFFAPRMGEFLGNLSVAEAMGDLYGKHVRIITAIASVIGTAGLVGIQLKLAGTIFEYALDIPSIYGVIMATAIVTLYSAMGGVKSVTFTDVIQFLTFGVAVPVLAYALLTSIANLDTISHTLATNPLFNYKEVFDFSEPFSRKQLFLFLFFISPGFSPQIFQRISIAKNTNQVRASFIIAAITCLLLGIMINWIAVLTLSINPLLNANDVVKHVMLNSSYVGLKGMMLAGVMAMIMSTVDSCINSTAVIVIHDFCKPLKIRFITNEIFAARISSILLGSLSLILSLQNGSLLELLVITESFYAPIVSVPFVMAILGFRSTAKSVILGMTAGFATVLLWDYVLQIQAVNSICFAMISNLMVLMGSHYLLKQKGGWVGIKDNAPLVNIRNERKLKFKQLLINIKFFNIIDACKKNCPQGEGLVSILGLFIMISAFSSTYTLDKESQLQYAYLLSVIYPMTFCASAALLSYPLWLSSWKDTGLIGVCWNISMFSVLICFSFLLILISGFSEIQLMVFMVNIIILSSVVTWRWSLVTITLGIIITTIFYQQCIHVGPQNDLLSLQFKVVYLLLLIVSTLIIFLRPKQEQQILTEERNEHLHDRIDTQEKLLKKALALRGEFIRNISHEYRAPMTGITSMAATLWESYDKFTDKQRKQAVETIFKSSARLESFDANITLLSKLSKSDYNIQKAIVDLSSLAHNRLKVCRKLYEENKKDREFIIDIAEGIIINGDKYYLSQLFDNLIINAINYCKKGLITTKLHTFDNLVHYSIIDNGIGIPISELTDVFSEFTVSSKTRTLAGGRGVGLALCKRIVEAHGGSILAKSDGNNGAVFTFNLPI